MLSETIPVAILGAGPAGLVTALELGRRGISAILFEDDDEPPAFPKANATTSRTMEHFRRLGFADRIRRRGLPEGYPQDIAYFTRYNGPELARLAGSGLRSTAGDDARSARWPTPEPLLRVQQMYVEQELLAALRDYPSIQLRLGWRAETVTMCDDHVAVEARPVAGGETVTVKAARVVGADGPRSVVRQALGISYEGATDFDRDFMGGRMLATYFRAPTFNAMAQNRLAWQYWAINREQRGLVCAIDGGQTFVLHTPLREGDTPSTDHCRDLIARTSGANFAVEIIGYKEWTAGFTLVASAFSGGKANPSAFIVGDAAHLFTPTGGQGYNTAVDDAVNLGWKLGAVAAGWGGPKLLASYTQERKPIALRNTGFARAMADSIGRIAIAPDIESETREGETLRTELGAALLKHAQTEFDIPGITFGVSYAGSDIVIPDGTTPPGDAWNTYTPTTVPGARAPHAWLADGSPIFDHFGTNFTLVLFGNAREAGKRASEAAKRAGIPLTVLSVAEPAVRELYQRDVVLVRPDHHIAWRGDDVSDDFRSVLATVTGH